MQMSGRLCGQVASMLGKSGAHTMRIQVLVLNDSLKGEGGHLLVLEK
jgi:hypothetical protein